MRVAMLRDIKDNQAKNFEKLKVTTKAASNDSFLARMLNSQLDSLMSRHDQVQRNISQLDFQTNQEQFRVVLVDRATTPRVPSNNKQLKYITTASLGLLLTILDFVPPD